MGRLGKVILGHFSRPPLHTLQYDLYFIYDLLISQLMGMIEGMMEAAGATSPNWVFLIINQLAIVGVIIDPKCLL